MQLRQLLGQIELQLLVVMGGFGEGLFEGGLALRESIAIGDSGEDRVDQRSLRHLKDVLGQVADAGAAH